MGKKMYYNEAEAAEKLGVSPEQLAEFVNQKQLRIYPDGAKKMYKASEVDALASPAQEEQEIELAPAEDEISLADETGVAMKPPSASDSAAGEQEITLEGDDSSGFDLVGADTNTGSTIAKVDSNQSDSGVGFAIPEEDDGTKSGFKADGEEELILSDSHAGDITPSSPLDSGELLAIPEGTSSDSGMDLGVASADGSGGFETVRSDETAQSVPSSGDSISIFDNDDLELSGADPMAKTQVAPSLEDQIALEGVGSGSGLLDLTRESDDTSLGAEVLDHIDMDGIPTALSNQTPGAGAADAEYSEPAPAAIGVGQTPPTEVVEVAAVEGPPDAMSGLFGGMAVGLAIVMLVMSVVYAAASSGVIPDMVKALSENVIALVAGGFFASVIFGIIGFVLNKSAMAKHQAMQRMM